MNPIQGSSEFLPAPGAKAAKTCGILSICFALTCIGIPVAVILAIVALVQQAKAKRAAQAEPGRFAPVSSTGLVTGIIGLVLPVVMLPFIGIVSAIAIPAFMGQRDLARTKAVEIQVQAAAQEAVMTAETQARPAGQPVDPEAVVKEVLAKPAFSLPQAKNVFLPAECAYVAADAPDHDGQVALKGGFTQGADGQQHPAVQIRAQIRKAGKSDVISKVVTLD